MTLMPARRALRSLRAVPAVNWTATTLVRAIGHCCGGVPAVAVKHLPKVGTVRTRLPNGRTLVLRSQGDDWITNQVFWRGWNAFEPETVEVFWEWAREARVVLDVGAHVGYFSLLAGHANPSAQIWAFEPMPGLAGRLHDHIRLNGVANVRHVGAAVGSRTGTTAFYYSAADGPAPSSSSASYAFMEDRPAVRAIDVPMTSVDDFVSARGLPGVDLVKIDTESTEADVLEGMRATIERHRPRIIVEVLRRGPWAQVDAIARRHGYGIYLLTGDGPARRDRIEPDPQFRNWALADSLRQEP